MKQCRSCAQEKPLSEYYKGRASCKDCYNKKLNEKRRISLYGVNPKEYNELFDSQNGNCAICGTHQSQLSRSLHLDHCHTTGKVRGLLCSNCNTAIGKLNDDTKLLEAAAEYIRSTAG